MSGGRRAESRREADVAVAERILPHNLEAERAVLGGIIVRAQAWDVAGGVLKREDFYRDAHRRIFAAMAVLHEAGATIDLVTLKDALARRGDLDDVGGPAYVAALIDGVPGSMNVEHYARIVKEKARLRAVIFAANKLLAAAYDAGEDAGDIVQQADRMIVELQRGGEEARVGRVRDGIGGLFDELEYRLAHKGTLTGIETGFKDINDVTMGWQAGELIILAARPSIGKTTFALNSAVAASQAGKHVAIFSLEMRRRQLENRLLSALSDVALTRILSGYIGDADWSKISHAMGLMSELNIVVDDRAHVSAWDVRSVCRKLKAEQGLDLVMIDYVQLMPGTLDRKGVTRNEEVTDISRRLKILADDLSVPIIVLSQLNRGADGRGDPRPKLSDLRDSGALEQDADIVAFLHRKNHREPGPTQFIIEKQRNGPTGAVWLTLDRDVTRFTNGADVLPAPEPEPAPERPRQTGFFRRGRG